MRGRVCLGLCEGDSAYKGRGILPVRKVMAYTKVPAEHALPGIYSGEILGLALPGMPALGLTSGSGSKAFDLAGIRIFRAELPKMVQCPLNPGFPVHIDEGYRFALLPKTCNRSVQGLHPRGLWDVVK